MNAINIENIGVVGLSHSEEYETVGGNLLTDFFKAVVYDGLKALVPVVAEGMKNTGPMNAHTSTYSGYTYGYDWGFNEG
jgi:hypothetical protein